MLHRFVHAYYLRVRFGIGQAGEPVTGVAADASALVRTVLVEHDPQGNMERLESGAGEVVGQVLNPRLVADRGVRIRRAGRRFGWIFTAMPVYLVQPFSLRIVRFKVVIADRPCGR